MFEITGFTSFALAFFAVASIGAGLAAAGLARIVADARAPKSRPVVLVTTERTQSRVAA